MIPDVFWVPCVWRLCFLVTPDVGEGVPALCRMLGGRPVEVSEASLLRLCELALLSVAISAPPPLP
jgi:hypothetical protein